MSILPYPVRPGGRPLHSGRRSLADGGQVRTNRRRAKTVVPPDQLQHLEDARTDGLAGHRDAGGVNQDAGLDAALFGDRPEARFERLAIERVERRETRAEGVQVFADAGRRQMLLDGGRIELDPVFQKRTHLRQEVAKPARTRLHEIDDRINPFATVLVERGRARVPRLRGSAANARGSRARTAAACAAD